jgi:hypothetical protein
VQLRSQNRARRSLAERANKMIEAGEEHLPQRAYQARASVVGQSTCSIYKKKIDRPYQALSLDIIESSNKNI